VVSRLKEYLVGGAVLAAIAALGLVIGECAVRLQ
jgi:hypothetical protein